MRNALVLLLLLMAAPLHAQQSFDYSLLDPVFKAHVVNGGVDYAGLQADRVSLDRHVTLLGMTSRRQFESWSRADQIAFLINAYNAFVIQQVIDDYPIKRSLRPTALVRPANSVWQIDGFFSDIKHRLLDEDLTLDQIEHEWLRAKYKEPRIHFALVCAAASCPPLRNEVYRGERLETQLDDQARAFLNDRERNRFTNNRAELSEIFKWFGDDFGGERGLRTYLGKYLNPELAARIRSGDYKISYIDYDWTLNDVAR